MYLVVNMKEQTTRYPAFIGVTLVPFSLTFSIGVSVSKTKRPTDLLKFENGV